MADSATASAAAPPLLPTPPPICRLAPSPSSPASPIRRFAPSPDSLAPSICRPTSKNPGRASASESWVRDKAARAAFAPPSSALSRSGLAPPSSSMERTNGGRIPGRASLSTSWVKDKLAGTEPADAPAESSWVKRSLTLTSSDNCTGKKPRYDSSTPTPLSPSSEEDSDSDSEEELQFYGRPAFLNAPKPGIV